MRKNVVMGGGGMQLSNTLQKIPPAPPYLIKNERSLMTRMLAQVKVYFPLLYAE